MPAPSISAHPLAKLQKQLSGKPISPAFITKMKNAGIQTLQDIRKAGGIPGKENMTAKEQESAQRLEAHAYLGLLSEDVEVNEKLIGAGIGTFSAIAGTNKTAFLERAKGLGIAEDKAAALHAKAEAAEAYLTHLITAARVENTNDYAVKSAAARIMKQEGVDEECDVQECNSAVSPLAYLTELLGYAFENIIFDNKNNKFLNISTLNHYFYNRYFNEINNSCEEVNRQVRQVRIAVEVLRGYQKIEYSEKYTFPAYTALLTQIGTSYEELRRIVVAEPKKRQALAERLGIDLNSQRPDELDKLLLKKEEITETRLEQIFGLQDTMRHPLSSGVNIGGQGLWSWNFTGIQHNKNTDRDGNIYVRLEGALIPAPEPPQPQCSRILIYKSNSYAPKDLVAEGGRDFDINKKGIISIDLEECNNSGISGNIKYYFESIYSENLFQRFYFSVIPDLLAWRLNHLRTIWKQQDGLSDDYTLGKLPVIDPDLIGLEDLRNPTNENLAYKLWKKRRIWVDNLLSKMSAIWQTKSEGVNACASKIEKMLGVLTQKINYKPNEFFIPWIRPVNISILLQQNKEFQKGNGLDEHKKWLRDHWLTQDAFQRLVELATKALQKEPLAEEDWMDVESILVQVQKNVFRGSWVLEELPALGGNFIQCPLSYQYFWISIKEPKEGLWSPALSAQQPWIDPEVLKSDDLAIAPIGQNARDIWETRKKQLNDASARIRKAHTSVIGLSPVEGLISSIITAIDKPIIGPDGKQKTWDSVMTDIWEKLSTLPEQASGAIYRLMYMPQEDFMELFTLYLKEEDKVSLTDKEVDRAVAILTSAWKRKNVLLPWKNEEKNLQYWTVFGSRLPKWRASREARVLWQIALKQRHQIPAVDPDLLSEMDDCKMPFGPNPAYQLIFTRNQWLNKQRSNLVNLPFEIPTETDGGSAALGPTWRLGTIVQNNLGIPLQEILQLDQAQKQGDDIQKRLDQINLSYESLQRICTLAQMQLGLTDLLQSEWDDLYDIVVQALKILQYAAWKEKEQALGITISPDFFVPDSKINKEINPWRATTENRWNWEDHLCSRRDQENAACAAMAEVVDKTEEQCLAKLRDLLIEDRTIWWTNSKKNKAEALSQVLLLDFEISPCQKTTRVAQAILSLQKLFYLLNTDDFIDLVTEQNKKYGSKSIKEPLSLLDKEKFAQHWKWLGSYETWRAAVGVFLYPENILLPTLKKTQTPIFSRIVNDIRSSGIITPQGIQKYADVYSNYLRDISNLEQVVTSLATVNMKDSNGVDEERKVLFMFGIGGFSKKLYWSAYDEIEINGLPQRGPFAAFWDIVEIAELEDISITNICGAPVYNKDEQNKHIYLFFVKERRRGEDRPTLSFLRFNLISLSWEGVIGELELPDQECSVILAKQCSDLCSTPEVLIQTTGDYLKNNLYERRLNEKGDEWAEGNWDEFIVINPRKIGSKIMRNAIGFKKFNVILFENSFSFLVYDGYRTSKIEEVHLINDNATLNGKINLIISIDEEEERLVVLLSDNSERIISLKVGGFDDQGEEIDILDKQIRSPLDYFNNIILFDIFNISLFDIALYVEDNETMDLINKIGVNKKGNWISVGDVLLFLFESIRNGNESLITNEKAREISAKIIFNFLAETDRNYKLDLNYLEKNLYKFLNIDNCYTNEWLGWPQILFAIIDSEYLNKKGKDIKYVLSLHSISNFTPETFQFNEKCTFVNSYGLPYGIASKNTIIVTQEKDPYGNNVLKISDLKGLENKKLELNNTTQSSPFQDFLSMSDNDKNINIPSYIYEYFREYYYFLPIMFAYELSKKGFYDDALTWFKYVYDFAKPLDERQLIIKMQNNTSSNSISPINWGDPTDMHEVASNRPDTYTRYTILSIVQLLISYADTEFTRDTSESIEKALLLYEKAKDLLASPELHTYAERCKPLMDEVKSLLKSEPIAYSGDLIKSLKKANNRKTIAAFAKALGGVGEKVSSKKIEELNDIIRQGRRQSATVAQILERGAQQDTLWRKLLKDASAEQTLVAAVQSAPIFRSGNKSAGAFYLPKVGTYGDFPIPWNPLIQLLYLHVENNLNKIRTCRNIAGVKREVETYAAATDVLSAMPSIGKGGQLVLPTSILPPPVPYRYEFLIERAKQLVNIAQQMESAFLNAMEKRDAEFYGQLKARQDFQTAQSSVKLQNLRLKQAKDEVRLSEIQQKSAEVQYEYYNSWLQEGLTEREQQIIGLTISAGTLFAAAKLFLVDWWDWKLDKWKQNSSLIAESAGIALETTIKVLQIYATKEMREREWHLQLDLAKNAIQIGDQQIKIANDGVDITEQELTNYKLKVDHAKDIIEFLQNKDTNAELYDWMQSVLTSLYKYFLQQATATAKLAQSQLAFERQEPSPTFIQSDYWVMPSENAIGGITENTVDRFGLTGSARLLADLYKLDQHRFETEKRKLQLTKNISLAQVAPFEFQRFKETGILIFQTPMEWFDRDFPGHYLRMIKRVRTSVVALIPPIHGIKATLTNIGVSRIVTERNDLFQPIIAHRPPESVALTSPNNATGLFELESQNTSMMLPFEGLGVDTLWEFRMPKAANQFDYSTIADIILSMDYTALDNYDYRLQIIESLPKRFSGDRPYSFRYQFADAWYDLHNPDQSATPMAVTFRTRREDFPPNLDRVTIQHVLLYFAAKDKAMDEQEVGLTFLADNGESVALGGCATPVDGIISTRRGNGSAWLVIQEQPVAGTWTLTLPNTLVVRNLFAEEKIEDMLLVLTINGVTPEWPA